MSKKDIIKLIYRIIIVIVSGIGLYLNFKLLSFKTGILYFTNISNLLCFIYFTYLVLMNLFKKKIVKNDLYYIIKGMITMCITLTMFVYNFILAGDPGIYKDHMLECNLVHIVVPLLVIFDYIIFGEKGNLKKRYPLYWCFVLFAYQIFISIYSMFGGTFIDGAKVPYFYMDASKYGIVGVTINTFLVLIIYIAYGYLIQFIDNKIGKEK